MKSPTNRTWLKTELTLWALLIISALAFIGLVLLAWRYQSVEIVIAALTGYAALIAFMVYGNKELD